jgi:outer membrane protein TolC
MKRIFFMLAAAFIFAGTMSAEITTVNLSNAIDLALKNNLSISKTEKDIEVAQAQYGEAFADFAMPQVNGDARFTELDPLTVSLGQENYNNMISLFGPSFASAFQGQSLPTITNAYPDNYHAGISVTKTLFAGFRYWNAVSIRQAYLDLAKAKLKDMKNEVVSSVTTSFYNLFLIRENIKSQLDYNQSLREHVTYTSNNYVSGNATEFDFITANLRYKLSLPVLTDLSNSLKNEKLVFCQQIGINDPESVEIIGNLLDTTNIILPVTNKDEILNLALSNDIGLMTIDTSLQVARYSREIATGSMYPTLGAFFNYGYDLSKTNEMLSINRTWNSTWNAGIDLTWSFDSLIPFVSRTWNSQQEAMATVESLEKERNIATNSVTFEVQSLLLQLEEGKENISVSMDDVNLAKLGYRLADARYKAGNSTELEVIDAENSVVEAESRWSKSIFDYYSANVRLNRLIGKLN